MNVKIVRKKGETEKIFLQGDHKKTGQLIMFFKI